MKEQDKKDIFSAFSLVGSIGLNMAASLAVGVFAGRAADAYFSITPWATVLGILLGMLAGLWATYKRVMGK